MDEKVTDITVFKALQQGGATKKTAGVIDALCEARSTNPAIVGA